MRTGALLLLAAFPAVVTLVDDVANGYWGLLAVVGLVLGATLGRADWRALMQADDLKWPLLLLLIYLSIAFLSYTFIDGSDFAKSRLQRHSQLLGVVLVLVAMWRLRPRLDQVLAAMSVNAVVIGAYALFEAQRGVSRVDVDVTHAIHFGNTALWLAAFSLAAALYGHNWRSPLLYLGGVGFIAGFTASVLSASRAGWLGVMVAIVAVLALWGSRRYWRRTAIAMLIATVAVTALWQVDVVKQRVLQVATQWEQFEHDKYARSSVGVRFVLWENAWAVFKEAPVVGGGFSAFRDRMELRIEEGEIPRYFSAYKTEPHSEYLYQLSSRGVIGLLGFIALTGWFVMRSGYFVMTGPPRQEAAAVAPFVFTITLLVAGLTITILDQRYVINLAGYFLALSTYVLWSSETTRGSVS